MDAHVGTCMESMHEHDGSWNQTWKRRRTSRQSVEAAWQKFRNRDNYMDMHARPQAVPTCDPEALAFTDASCAKSLYKMTACQRTNLTINKHEWIGPPVCHQCQHPACMPAWMSYAVHASRTHACIPSLHHTMQNTLRLKKLRSPYVLRIHACHICSSIPFQHSTCLTKKRIAASKFCHIKKYSIERTRRTRSGSKCPPTWTICMYLMWTVFKNFQEHACVIFSACMTSKREQFYAWQADVHMHD